MDNTEGKPLQDELRRLEDAMKEFRKGFESLQMVNREEAYQEVANAIADAYDDTYEGESIPVWIRRTGERLGRGP